MKNLKIIKLAEELEKYSKQLNIPIEVCIKFIDDGFYIEKIWVYFYKNYEEISQVEINNIKDMYKNINKSFKFKNGINLKSRDKELNFNKNKCEEDKVLDKLFLTKKELNLLNEDTELKEKLVLNIVFDIDGIKLYDVYNIRDIKTIDNYLDKAFTLVN